MTSGMFTQALIFSHKGVHMLRCTLYKKGGEHYIYMADVLEITAKFPDGSLPAGIGHLE